MTGLSLPLLATLTGGRTPDRYCSGCLDHWARRDLAERQRMHPACLELLEAIRTAPDGKAAA